jgi:hypothetical protein
VSTTVSVWWSGQLVEVTAHPTPVPGLVVHADYSWPGVWVITHAPSGAAILKLTDPEGALHAAIRLGELADWLDRASILRDKAGLREQVLGLACELDCLELSTCVRAVTDTELARAEAANG